MGYPDASATPISRGPAIGGASHEASKPVPSLRVGLGDPAACVSLAVPESRGWRATRSLSRSMTRPADGCCWTSAPACGGRPRGWPAPADASWLQGGFTRGQAEENSVRLAGKNGGAVVFTLVDGGRALELRYEKPGNETIRVLGDALTIAGDGYVIVPSREGLLIPVQGDKAFKRVFGTSEYEGCHMNMLGFVKDGLGPDRDVGRCVRLPRDREDRSRRTQSARDDVRASRQRQIRATDAARQRRLEYDCPRVPHGTPRDAGSR